MPRLVPPVVAGLPAQQPVLAGGDLVLRPFAPSDGPDVQAAYEDPAIHRWHCFRLDDQEAAGYAAQWQGLWSRVERAGWAAVRAGELVGRVTLTNLQLVGGQAEVTYWTVPSARGTGVASKAVEVVTAWAFEVGLNRLELEHSTHDDASCRVAARAGYVLEGTRRRAALHADGWHDMHLHARLA